MDAPGPALMDLVRTLLVAALLSGLVGGVLALALATLIRQGYHAAVAAFDEREARKRLTARHYRELFGDRDDGQ